MVAGNYEITRVLAVGGMGVVYEAHDRVLLRTVAIKAPLFAGFAQSVRAEAQALAMVHSPAFVTVHHVAVHEGVELIVMERLFGETVEARLDDLRSRGKRMPLHDVLDLLVAVADALSTAHGAGVAQRDLKPANIMVCGERIVLLDLGLFVPEVLVSEDNEAAGSAEYIAPEVLLHTVTKGGGPLIDLYALGVLAFELLTNETPYASENIGTTLARHVGAEIPDVRDLRPDVPVAVAALVKELLAKEPMARPASAEAVLWQLKDIRSHGLRRSKHMMVLAIDDEPHVGQALKRSLESSFPQIEVQSTTDPTSVIDEIRTTADVVLVDLNMPEHNGVEVCMSLLSLPAAEQPVIVAMSSQATDEDVEVLRSIGIRHFVPKDHAFVVAMSQVIREVRNGLAEL
ncbi:MAG: response regulator [Deltaproteobacteria bacterium]|nr:response regulator [Deltaproteobacteria bacterium]